MKRTIAALTAVATAAVLAGCSTPAPPPPTPDATGESFAAIEGAARAEGSLVWYVATPNSLNEKLLAAFKAQYPEIEVSLTRLNSGDLTTRFSSEKGAGAASADIITLSDDAMLAGNPDWFIPLDATTVPNLDAVPARYIQDHHATMYASPMTITINTDLVDEPETWEDLLAPEWAGKGSLASPSAAGSFMATYSALRGIYGDEFLEDLGASGMEFYDSTATIAPLVAAGGYGFFSPTTAVNSRELRDAGAPLEVVAVTPIIALTGVVGVNSEAEHPNAALVLLNFLYSQDAQALFCGDEAITVIDSGDSSCKIADESLNVVDYAKASADSAEILELMGLD